MITSKSRSGIAAFSILLMSLVGCASFNPTPIEEVGFKDRAQTQTSNGITVSVAVLSAEEANAAFDTKLYKKKIQPIWVEITRRCHP